MKLLATTRGKLLAAVVALILLYSAAGFLLFPVILNRVAAQGLTKFLGRTVTIGKIDFNPFAMSVAVHGFRIDESKGGVFLSIDTLNATIAPLSSLVHRTWIFKGVALIGPHITLVRNENSTLNFADLLLLHWPKVPRFRVGLLQLLDGKVSYRDASVSGGFSTTISRLTVEARDVSTSPDHENVFSVSAVSEPNERFSWNGSLRLDPLSSHGQMAAENLGLLKYAPYFNERFTFTIADGTLTTRASYDVDFARDRFKVLLHDGAIAAHSLKAYEHGNTAPLLGFRELALNGADVDMVRHTVKVSSIVITGGSAVLRRLGDKSFNVQHLMKPVRSPSVSKAAPSGNWNVSVDDIRLADFAAEVNHVIGRETLGWKELRLSKPAFQMNPLSVSIAGVTLQDGKLVFTDPSFEPPVRMSLTHLDIRVGAFSTANPRLASLAVHARINDAAPLQISGETNPIGAQGETNLRGVLQDVNLVPLSLYAAKYLGYELAAADLNLDSTFSIQSGQLDAQNKIEIYRLALGRKTESKDATKLPVRLVIALLRDSTGKITLNVPIKGTLADPKFELQKAIIEAVLNPFTKTVTFPFAALGAQLGGGGEELGFQEFSPGSAELVPQEIGKLDTILQGLNRWPEFMLDIEGSVDIAKDTGDLQLLAANRARSVKDYLLRLGTLEPDRIFLIDNSLEKVPQQGSRALLHLKDEYRGPDRLLTIVGPPAR